MRISESFLAGARIDQRHSVHPAHTPASAVRSSCATPQDGSSYTRAPELAQLVARLDEIDAVRPELIQEVSGRLAAGVYDSRAALERTADAMLEASA